MRLVCLTMRLLFLTVLTTTLCAAGLEDFDRPVAWVGRTVFTQGDLNDRMSLQLSLLRQRGQMPRTRVELQAVQDQALNDLIEEELLVQEARRLGMALDLRRLYQEVVKDARRAGMATNIAAIAEGVSMRERTELARGFLYTYERAIPTVGPQEVAEAYEARRAQYVIVGRWRLFQLSLVPTSPEVLAALRQDLLALVRRVRSDAAVREAISQAQIDAIVEADGQEQLALLRTAMQGVVEGAGKNPELVVAAQALIQRLDTIRDDAAVTAQLASYRQELLAIADPAARLARFQELARSAGGIASERGGELGWLEEASLSAEQRTALQGLEAGGLSEAYRAGQAQVLLLAADREPPRQRTLAEVAGEIEAVLTRERHETMRNALLSRLREKEQVVILDRDQRAFPDSVQ